MAMAPSNNPAQLDAVQRQLQSPAVTVQELMKLATGSVPNVPGFLAMNELARRNSMQNSKMAQNAGQKPTVLQQQAMGAMPQQPQMPQAQAMPQMPQAQAMPQMPQAQPMPQMPQQAPQPQQPVQAAEGGLMHLPMRPDMFRRNDYAQGGVVHFGRGGFSVDTGSGVPDYGTPEDTPTNNPLVDWWKRNTPGTKEFIAANTKHRDTPADIADQEVGQAMKTKPTGKNEQPRILGDSAGGGGGGIGGGAPTGGINKETYAAAKPFLDKAMEYLNEAAPARKPIEQTEKELAARGLDKPPTTDTSEMQKIMASYNQPRHWTDNLSMMKQDALRNPSGGFGSMDIGGTARQLDAANTEKSNALRLKMEEIKNLDAKAIFATKQGNYKEAERIEAERDKLVAEIKKAKGLVGAHVATGIAGFAKMPSMGGGGGSGGIKGTVGLNLQDQKYLDQMANEFVETPNNRSPFWEYLPPELKNQLQSQNKAERKHGMEQLQKNMPLYMQNYRNDYLQNKSQVVKKQLAN
jgi:hypothetical protein